MQETIPEYTVSEISFAIKRTMEDAFARVRVRGEIFGCKRADSGHYYLSLKDENANLSAVCWKGVAAGLKVKPEDGLEVVAAGRITTFAGKSSYQLVIEQMEVAGAGALLKLREERKQKFAAEGVVTSPAGAVIRDIIHRVTDRFPVRIIVWPTLVQGEGAAEQIAAAVNGFNRLPADGPVPRPDLLIVARGGGSLEDLWCFNEEIVIRAVYDSEIPLISAVGHETDTMLIDFVSDLRAPTPTGAAEFAVPVKSELEARLLTLQSRLFSAGGRYLQERRSLLDGLKRGIPNLEQILSENMQKLDDRSERLRIGFKNYLENRQNRLNLNEIKPFYITNILDKKNETLQNLGLRLESVSVEAVLKRGFAWIRNGRRKTVCNADEARKNGSLEIVFADGAVKVRPIVRKNELQGDLFDD